MTSAAQAVKALLEHVGVDTSGKDMLETPERAARALRDLTSGYGVDVPSLFKTFDNEGYDQIVLVKDIPYYSLCAHHVLPFWGHASVAYIPNKRIVGLSKLARVVEAYAQRLQVQEAMTQQIAEAIEQHLRPKAVAVIVDGQHLCMRMRGVEKSGTMKTSCLKGAFRKNEAARIELFDLMKN